jgi:hypothetical protein
VSVTHWRVLVLQEYLIGGRVGVGAIEGVGTGVEAGVELGVGVEEKQIVLLQLMPTYEQPDPKLVVHAPLQQYHEDGVGVGAGVGTGVETGLGVGEKQFMPGLQKVPT